MVQTIDNKLFAFSAADGSALWQHEDDAPLLSVRGTSSPLVTDKMVLGGFDSGKLIAFNPENGSLIWEAMNGIAQGANRLERMVDIDGSPLLQGDVIYAVTYQVASATLPRNGRSLWFQDSNSYQAPAHSLGQVFVTESDSTVRAFRAGSGQVI